VKKITRERSQTASFTNYGIGDEKAKDFGAKIDDAIIGWCLVAPGQISFQMPRLMGQATDMMMHLCTVLSD